MEPNTNVNVNINVTANTAGVDQAESSLSGFSSQLSQVGSIAAGIGLANVFSDVGSAITGAVEQTSQFQTATTAVGTILSNTGNTATTMSDNMAAGASKVANALQQEQDATISYNEKVASLQDKIATVMQGQNVIDAQTSMYDQLNTLAEDHAEKVQALEQQITDTQTNEANSLQDMKDGQDVKMQDLAEKHAQQMANATSDIKRAALEKSYNEEVQYDTDSFNRAYALKKSQDDRNTAQKIASINDQIAKENDAYAEQYAKDKALDEKRISDLEAKNAKELADYKQQLSDEERLYAEHMAKLQETASGGGSGGSASAMMKMLPSNSDWLAQKMNLNDWMSQVNKMAQTSPYNYFDIVQYGRLVEAQGYNFLKLEPIIENIGAASGKSFGTTTQALMDGINGRIQMMSMELGLSKEKLEAFGAEYTKGIAGHLTNQQSFFNAIEKISKGPDAGAANAQLHTLAGSWSNVQDAVFRTEAAITGFNPVTTKTSGAFKILSDALLNFSNWLNKHQGDIVTFINHLGPLFVVIGIIAGVITLLLIPALLAWATVSAAKTVASIIDLIAWGWKAVPMMFGMSIGGDTLSVSLLGVTIPAALVVLGIAAIILVGYELITHWHSLATAGVQAWNTIGNAIRDVIKGAIDWINKLIKGLNHITGGKLNIPTIQYNSTTGAIVGGALGSIIPGFGTVLGAVIGGGQNSTDTWNPTSQNWQANPLEGQVGSLLNTIMGAGVNQNNKLSSSGLGGSSINITNYNNIQGTQDLSALQKKLGLQVAMATH